MCGIFAINSVQATSLCQIAIAGLKRLEYRGYDSAGLAFRKNNQIDTEKCLGGPSNLVAEQPDCSQVIGHTRWATHGVVNLTNAHPHYNRQQTIYGVHNGIIDNAKALKTALMASGWQPISQTDTEVAIEWLSQSIDKHGFEQGLLKTFSELRGSFVLIFLQKDNDAIWVINKDRDVVIGRGSSGHYVASDEYALTPFVHEIAHCNKDGLWCIKADRAFSLLEHPLNFVACEQEADIEHDSSSHMLREIFYQPRFLSEEILRSVDFSWPEGIEQVHFIGCGSSLHAAQVAQYWLQQQGFTRPIGVFHASEYRYMHPLINTRTALVLISQSGETADTLSVLHFAKNLGAMTIAFCNVPRSSLAREADHFIPLQAGREFAVASTKAFTAQLLKLYQALAPLAKSPSILGPALQQAMAQEKKIIQWAQQLQDKQHLIYIGRQSNYPLACEGALKIKEIAYVHAQAYPAGELKHGPLALVDRETPIIALNSEDALPEKMHSNLEEIRSREGRVYLISDQVNDCEQTLSLDQAQDPLSFALASSIAMQLLAYHVCHLRGHNPDQPRNLAKSVTVD